MSDSIASLRRKIASAGDLQGVVRTMKALAASGIGQYEESVRSLAEYYRTVELGLSVCLKGIGGSTPLAKPDHPSKAVTGAVVFGSDQGLVGQFNETIADHTASFLKSLPGRPQVWVVGERIRWLLADAGLQVVGSFTAPASVQAIAQLVGEIQVETERCPGALYVIHNRPVTGALYEPVDQRLLPLDEEWRQDLIRVEWPTANLPEVLCSTSATLAALIRGYLFISLFRACAESLASENASRLAAMQRAEKNIDELLATLHVKFQSLRQSSIDEELFDVISGFEALGGSG